MFQKLNIKLDIELKKLRGKYARLSTNTGYFIECHIADQDYLNMLLDNVVDFQIPPDHAMVTKISHGGGLTPHRDAFDTALNFYIHAEKEVTTYYDNPSGYYIFDPTTGLYGYDPAQLIPVGNFVANTNDCYLLDTTLPHNVSYTVKNSSRTLLRFIWDRVPFEEVLESILIK